jgi:hypothetical protein
VSFALKDDEFSRCGGEKRFASKAFSLPAIKSYRSTRRTLTRSFRLRVCASALVALSVLQAAVGCAQSPPPPKGSSQSSQPPNKEQKAAVPKTVSLPKCPAVGSHPVASTSGAHNVTLTWIASATAIKPGSSPIGYCLYRSSSKIVSSGKDFKCVGCEQINLTPITNTGCLDDQVQNETTYYYVAAAINEAGLLSGPSNLAQANIPSASQKPKESGASSYAACRDLASAAK